METNQSLFVSISMMIATAALVFACDKNSTVRTVDTRSEFVPVSGSNQGDAQKKDISTKVKTTTKACSLGKAANLAAVTYAQVKPIIDTNCVGCHGPTGQAPDLSTYAALKISALSSLTDMKSAKMPIAKPVSPTELATFQAWYDGGSLLDATTPPTSTPSPATGSGTATGTAMGTSTVTGTGSTPPAPTNILVTYDNTIKDLLDKNCVSCHKAGATPPDLSTYTAADNNSDGSWTTIQNNSMPKATKLSDDLKAKFKSWVDNGTPENDSGTNSAQPPTANPDETSGTPGTDQKLPADSSPSNCNN